tara:strand:+ start:634 stop:1389 length:756 start_codon:yes stop_codon:yes gene_type:complete
MKKKRLIGVVTIKDDLAVQSFGYKNYLPLGKPEIIVKNLDIWGADEILVNVIDRSNRLMGPNYKILKKISSMKISTPLIYGGGIQKLEQAIKVISYGADRILLDSLIKFNFNEIKKISNNLGSQALILSMPSIYKEKKLYRYDYIDKKNLIFNNKIIKLISKNFISELLITDVENEGTLNKFNFNILDQIKIKNANLILFGGLCDVNKILKVLKKRNINAVCIGNGLNYKENNINFFKSNKLSKLLRTFNE